MSGGSEGTMERRPHPWNQGFTWDDHEGPFTTLSPQQVAQFDEAGYTVVPDVFDAATLSRIDAEIRPGEEAVRGFLGDQPGGRFSVAGLDTQTVAPHLVLRSPWLRDFCGHPLLAGICRDLVGPEVRLYWEQAVYKQPKGAEPVLWHQDNGYTYVEPQAYLTCWIAPSGATEENGCIEVLPGVHRGGTLAHRDTPLGFECWGDPDAAVTVPVSAGSIVVFSSLTPHRTAPNRTDEVRKAYIVQYCQDGAGAYEPGPDGVKGPRTQQADPARQDLVVSGGRPVRDAARVP